MKLLLTADWHIASKAPALRIDDYVETQKGKIKWLLDEAERQDCRAILVAGDVFDTPVIPFGLVTEYLRLFGHYSHRPIIAVYGQHDLRYRRRNNTPLYLLNEVDCSPITILDSDFPRVEFDDEVAVYGAGWGERIPKPVDKSMLNVLIAHMMVVDGKLWPGQTSYVMAGEMHKRLPYYQLVVTGDNHKTISSNNMKTMLVNPGSLMRAKADQIGHVPMVVIYDTAKETSMHLVVPHMPIGEVMDVEKAELDKEAGGVLASFVDSLKLDYEAGADFGRNIGTILKDKTISPGIKAIIREVIEHAKREQDQSKRQGYPG